MASIEKRARDGKVRWYARYRDPAGRQRTKTFDRKVDADRLITTVEASKLVGTYIDPTAARLTVGAWSKRWIDGQTHLKPSTAERYQGILREHIIPRWGTTKLSDVNHGDVQAWVSQLSKTRSAATTRKVHRVLSLILDLAVKDDRLARNNAAGVSLPRVVPGERRYLTHLQVRQLADKSAAPAPELMSKHRRHSERRADEYRLVVLFLAYTGVRFGEMAALRVGRLDLLRRRAAIVESVVEVKGALVPGNTKGS